VPSLKTAFPSLLAAALLVVLPSVRAQELVEQATPFTALLDFATLETPEIPRAALPIWLESVQVVHDEGRDALLPGGLI
jgi:hypothetical protein